jgi:hypothetical protein
MKASCEYEAKWAELDFSRRLPAAFLAANECKTVQFIVASDHNRELEDSLTKNVGSMYWKLRVDFHPRLERQPFTLGSGRENPQIRGDDAEHNADFICQAAKHNGVIAIW